jgi:dTDP-4-amino-4,6-dideoxygalactose transaminase
MDRILLSGPDVGEAERSALLRAFDDGWIAPVGPELTAFENELAAYTGAEACVALASGTAGLHLALLDVGVVPGDEVVVQSATFAASAFATAHAGAVPVFCDVDEQRWCLSADLLEELLAKKAAMGRLPKAVMPVDLYGACADYQALSAVCERYEVPIVEDAAEGLGSISGERMAGTFGRSGVLSFNGNKIITTSGGGALLGSAEVVDRARYLATQARLPELHYEHVDIGFNYRMSNLLAAFGRAQLAGLEVKIARRDEIHHRYRTADGLSALNWCPFDGTERPNRWLNVALLPDGFDPTAVCRALDAVGIEARPAWKPMHLQPVFAGSEMVGGTVSEGLFDHGLCLPSSSALTDDEVDRVIGELTAILAGPPLR